MERAKKQLIFVRIGTVFLLGSVAVGYRIARRSVRYKTVRVRPADNLTNGAVIGSGKVGGNGSTSEV